MKEISENSSKPLTTLEARATISLASVRRVVKSDVDVRGERKEWRGEAVDEIAEQISKLDQKPLTNSEKYVIIAGRSAKGKQKRPGARRTGITHRSRVARPAARRKAGRKRGEAHEQLHIAQM